MTCRSFDVSLILDTPYFRLDQGLLENYVHKSNRLRGLGLTNFK